MYQNKYIQIVYCIDPLHIVGMQPIWGAKQMKFSLLGIEILLFCPPDWLHSHWRARGLYLSIYINNLVEVKFACTFWPPTQINTSWSQIRSTRVKFTSFVTCVDFRRLANPFGQGFRFPYWLFPQRLINAFTRRIVHKGRRLDMVSDTTGLQFIGLKSTSPTCKT